MGLRAQWGGGRLDWVSSSTNSAALVSLRNIETYANYFRPRLSVRHRAHTWGVKVHALVPPFDAGTFGADGITRKVPKLTFLVIIVF